MTRPILADTDAERPARRLAGTLETAAFVLLLACVASRAFLAEMPYRTSSLRMPVAAVGASEEPRADRSELARVTFAVLLLAAGGLWILAGAVDGRLVVRCGWLAAPILVFAVLSFVSAVHASDKRSALDAWIEQVSLLAGAFLAAQLCGRRGRFATLAVVLAAVGGALAVKGIWQVFVEVPDRIADFEMYQAERLRQVGAAPDSPKAALFEARLRGRTPFGYFALANLFASMLIVLFLAGAGLAAGKFAAALRLRKLDKTPRQKGEIHLPTLAAVLTAGAAALVAAVLLLTRSRGGIVSAAVAFCGAAAALIFRRRLAAHWRRAMIGAALVLVLGVAGTVAFGVARDRLPTRTMTFRWYYWTASAEIVRDHPLWGVGPGNFSTAYLQYRRAEGEESVKAPHNVVMHSLSQFGLPGGACYLLVVLGVLVGACRPRKKDVDAGPDLSARPTGRGVLLTLLAVAVAPLIARLAFADHASDAYLLLFETVFPVMALAVMLVLFAWWGQASGRSDAPMSAVRVALAAGAVGFVLHNMVGFALWAPGAATVFWIAAGACLAGGRGRSVPGVLRRPAAVAAVAVVAAAVVLLYLPVSRRTSLADRMLASYRAGAARRAADLAVQAAITDRLDPIAAADAARMILASCRPGGEVHARLQAAETYAQEAHKRDPDNYAHARLAGAAAWYVACPDAFNYARATPAGDIEDAAAELERRLSESAGDPILLNALAAIRHAQGDYAEAVLLLERAAAVDPRSATLRVRLGNAAWRAGQPDKARAAWKRAGALAPAGEPVDRALALMDRAVKLNPMDFRLRIELAGMLCSAGRPRECLEQVRTAEQVESRLLSGSVEKFTPAERKQIEALRARSRG